MIGDETKQGNKILTQQLEFYKKNNIPIHIMKNDSRFLNGLILELQFDLLILDDYKLGGVPVFFNEIKVLEKFTPK